MLNLLQNYRKEHTIQPQQQIQEDILSIQKAVSELKFDVIEKKIDSILQNLKKSNSNTFAKDFEIASSIDTAIRKHIEIAEDNQYAKSLEALNTPKYNERGDISQLETLKAFVKTYAKESPVIFMKNQYIDNISTAVHRQDYSLVTNLISTMRKSLGYERQLTEFDKTEIYSRTKDTLMPMIQDAKNSKLVRSWELGEKLIQTKQPTMRDMIVFSDVFKTEKGMQRGNVREPAVQKAASRNI